MPDRSFAHLSERYPRIIEDALRFVSHEHLAEMLEGSKNMLGGPLTLSCGVPRNGTSSLAITGSAWVNTEIGNLGDFALFFPPSTIPGVFVEFEPIDRLARHLVEFQIQAGSPSAAQSFHIEGPGGLSEDVSITHPQLISCVVGVVPGDTGIYTVSLRQINIDPQNASWVFRWVRVSSIA